MQMQRVLITIALLFGFVYCTAAAGSSEIVTVEVEAAGLDREEAIFAGLAEALRQVRGVDVVSERQRTTAERELVVRDANGSEQKLAFERNQSGEIQARTEGFIEGYRVLSARQSESRFVVELSVDIPVFRAPGSASHEARRRMAIYPVASEARPVIFGDLIDERRAAARITQALVTAMTGTRRFAVLERERTADVEQEMALLRNPETPARETTRLGQVIGADYLLSATLVELQVAESDTMIQLTGERRRSVDGTVIVEMRIIGAATRQIMWADTEVVQISKAMLEGVGRSSDAVLQRLSEIVAQQLAFRAVEAIYPMRVVSVSENGDFVINQGGDRLSVGDHLTIYELGEELVDPYSQQSLGRVENAIGIGEVVRVTNKLSYATLVDGAADRLIAVPNGSLLVRSEEKPIEAEGQQAPAERGPLLLPQDRL